jgi:hypothetical protein
VLDRQQRGVGMESIVYLKARQEWDERYSDLVLGKRDWQITAAARLQSPWCCLRHGLGQHPKQVRSVRR